MRNRPLRQMSPQPVDALIYRGLLLNPITSAEAWTGVADCLNCNIRQSVLFAGLREDGFSEVHRPIDQLQYAAGATIYRAGDDGVSLFTLRTGLVKLTHYLPDGGQRIVRLLRKTDVLGLECMISDEYQHSAIALQPAEVCRLPASAVKKLLHGNPRLFHTLMAQWYRALSDADRWITELSTGTARDRVIRLLLWLSEHEAGNSCSLFSREDLGAVLGLTTETASRVMAGLKREGLIRETALNRFSCDTPKLREIVGA
jgi:CRP/FNR family transcriptional regulator, anaerobic regulatory protein